ncbi:hypothetical protein Kpol_1010p46 [Vanderwaltozyma polyspora DSM 70294]|uniref:TOG domain-containing protein n=1 Tax=Vanderwaltozyma polyspora (strain ATCC 22028 / DSM 70294 / BCRC 21397 / CBS 2163 / NBRC 10782 / NRRL Y-8283 / UCD 57-17) TaxID=436907 RepID=A7TIJ2_VANPO|nr:uncharacterized protein Kpol_1010p46 [Vanderwaltozyma polyspora DSM 70294]EDO17930.1 hypothetical protein Kpol_1010p46 [Vanderwaltozyma polyspora DSM 70294]
MSEQDDIDFTKLSLDERLNNKLWKARLHGYQELIEIFERGNKERCNQYWKDPNLFSQYLGDANVVAQEQAVVALSTLLNQYYDKTLSLPINSNNFKQVLQDWLPILIEKCLSSTRNLTKTNSLNCILKLCSFDNSIFSSIEIILPILNKKGPPKILISSLLALTEIIKNFTFINIDVSMALPILVENLPKLAAHADKNIRSNTMDLIVEIYDKLGRNQDIIQDLLLDQLKPIQQRDLITLFNKLPTNDINDNSDDKIMFQWERKQSMQNLKENKNSNENFDVDEDGDTVMEFNTNNLSKTSKNQIDIDPFTLLKEETILDRFPEDFYGRLGSAKWKDRVEALQEYYDNVLMKTKRIRNDGQDYSLLISTLASIIQKDANVQAVTIAAQSIDTVIEKLRLPGFNKNLVNLCFIPLLERTKEKKQSVIEAIRGTLYSIVKYHNPISNHNEDLLQEILKYMKHKIPQIRMESTMFLNYILKNYNTAETTKILSKYLEEEIVPNAIKIANDTQPSIRNEGFETLAILIKIFIDSNDYDILKDPLDKLDNLKRKKIEEIVTTLPEFAQNTSNPKNFNEEEKLSTSPLNTDTNNVFNGNSVSANNSFLNKSTIPSKRVATSPLRKLNTKTTLPTKSSLGSTPRIALPTKPLNVNRHTQQMENFSDQKMIKLEVEINELKKDKQEWLKERHKVIEQLNNNQRKHNQLLNEIEMLKKQLQNSQTTLHEKNLQLRSKELQLNKLQDRITQLEGHNNNYQPNQNIPSSSSSSLSNGRLFSNSLDARVLHSEKPLGTYNKIGHTRTGSASSDDLPHRVDLLQIDSSSNVNDTFVNEESWKRAAEVTSQLKARIERMREKSRGIGN